MLQTGPTPPCLELVLASSGKHAMHSRVGLPTQLSTQQSPHTMLCRPTAPLPLPPLCPLPGAAAGFIVERTGSFASVFHITAALYVLGTLVWNAFCSAEKQFD